MERDTVYLFDCTRNEFLYFFGFSKSIFINTINRSGSRSIWNFSTIMCTGICFWRWFLERDVSNQCGIIDCTWNQWCGLWEMAEMESAVSVSKSGGDKWFVVIRICDWILERKVIYINSAVGKSKEK